MSTVIRTKNFTECSIPTACISLSFYGNKEDNDIYPARDTCGCSFHSSAEAAIFGAIKESIERQFLIRFWTTGQCSEIISNSSGADLLNLSTERLLLNSLCLAGEVTIIDITDRDFPGACLLTLYGCRSKKRNVRYCAGISYSETRQKALEKALLELWQTYRFIDVFTETSNSLQLIEDPYLLHFLQCNDFRTYEEISTTRQLIQANQKNAEQLNTSTLLEKIRELDLNGYLYIRPVEIKSNLFYFCKFISPNLFMHMNNANNINLANRYSDKFTQYFIPARLSKMVPFP
ncbi:YcaO cyclodehydratase, ATP-ad Mg2+-binding [compost metagenome]